MTWDQDQDPDRLTRWLGGAVWLAMSLALAAEICLLVGWAVSLM